MSKESRHLRNQEILKDYLKQPECLPESIRTAVEAACDGGLIQLYALSDLNASYQQELSWLVLCESHLCLVKTQSDGKPEQVKVIQRSEIQAIRENPGLSCIQMSFLAEPDEPALLVVRYSHRQSPAMSSISFVLRQELEKNPIQPGDADHSYGESMAAAVKNAQASISPSRMSVFWRLAGYLKPYKVKLAFGFVAACLMTSFMLIPPVLVRGFINDTITPYHNGKLDYQAALHAGIIFVASFAAVWLLHMLFVYLRLRLLAVMGEQVARDLRNHLYSHLQRLSISYFSKMQTGSIISRVSSDTDRIWDFIAFGVVEVSVSVILLVGISIMMLSLDLGLGLILVLPIPLIVYAIFWNGKHMHRIFLRIWRKWSDMTAVLSDTIPGIRVVKAFNQEETEKKRFGHRNEVVMEDANRIHYRWTAFWPLLMFSIHLMTIAFYYFALHRLLGDGSPDSATMRLGDLFAFMGYISMLHWPLESIGQMSRMINRSLSSAHRIFEVLDTEPDEEDPDNLQRLEPVEGNIEFDKVTFGYEPVRQILKGVSFDVKAGEFIGFVGPSGAGKTTIINLIAKFYDAKSGTIRVDGVDIKNVETGHYRCQIGMVMQDSYLFHGSIVDNIRYGKPDAPIQDVINAARTANAHDFICKLPHAYDTIVGERGHTLSGGERQRISIARAVLHDPRLLILDEATSSVDTETERNIQEALNRLTQGRTVLAIAHRLSTLKRADRLFVIKEGRLVEQGKHEELLAIEDGVYRKLHDMQQELHEMYAV